MSMHIAIIGAGISGLLTALELVEHGCQVSIFDQQRAGQAASWAGGGILSPMYPWRYPHAVNTLAQHGKDLYQTWNEKLLPHTGIDFEIHNTGMLIFDESDFEIGLDYAEHFHQPMQRADYVERDALEQINPWIANKYQHAIYFSALSNIRNPRLLQSIVQYLKQHPRVAFFDDQPIEKFIFDQDSIQAMKSATGQVFHADQFVLATGAWSQLWSDQLGVRLPVRPVQGQMLLFKTPAHWLPTMCMNQVMYLIPRQDGHVVCGSSMADCGYSTDTDTSTQQRILEACLDMVPELAQFPVIKRWAGLRPSSPTGVPYIGMLPNIENLWLNTGHFRNGLCMGPASARLLRQLMLDQPTFTDPKPYAPERLFQGSEIELSV